MNFYARLHLQDSYTADISCLGICVRTCVQCTVKKPKRKTYPAVYHSNSQFQPFFFLKQSALGNRGGPQYKRERDRERLSTCTDVRTPPADRAAVCD